MDSHRALEIAGRIASAAPLGVRGALRSARISVEKSEEAAIKRIVPDIQALSQTEDAQEAVMAMIEQRDPKFEGR